MNRLTVIGLAALAAAPGCRRATPPPVTPPPTVVVAPATRGAVPIVLEFNCTLQAIRSVQIIPRVTGTIMTRDFVEGALVEAGAPLYQIDPRPFQVQLSQHTAQLEADKAHEAYQASELERAREAFAQKALSENELLKYVAQAQEATAAVAATQAKIDGTKLDLEYAHITTPFAGRIQNTLINAGNLVTAEQSVLTTLVQIDPIYAMFNVSREQISRIQSLTERGLIAGASGPESWKTLTARLVLAGGVEYGRAGAVDFVAAQIDPNTDMLLARAIFPNPADDHEGVTLVPGQFARIRIELGTRPDAVLVPQRSVVETQAGTHVFVIVGDGKVENRPVVLGGAFGQQYVVEHGLREGEQVVVEGVQKVRAGMTVKVTMGD